MWYNGACYGDMNKELGGSEIGGRLVLLPYVGDDVDEYSDE